MDSNFWFPTDVDLFCRPFLCRANSRDGWEVKFASDSPLEEGVSSEPVSEWGSSAAGNYSTIPRRLWMITEAEKGHFGLEYAGIWVFALRQLLLLPVLKLLITLSFLPSAGLAAGEFTVYKKSRSDRTSAGSSKNPILFSYLERQGAHTNLPP